MLRLLFATLSAAVAAEDAAAAPCIATTTSLATSDYNSIVAHLRSAISASRNKRTVPNRKKRGDLVGGIVRLAFHDAAAFDRNLKDDTLGVDGCFDASNPDNAGLEELVQTHLDPLWQPFCSKISKADFWVLAAKVAVEETATQDIAVAFRYGRTTVANCSYDGPTRLPGAQTGLDEIRRVFQHQMGLTMRQAVALLGAHTLGRTENRISGFGGPWTKNPDRLDNAYYNTLVNKGWKRRDLDSTHTLWLRGGGSTIMLNADMELAFDAADHTLGACGGRTGGKRCSTNEGEVDGPYHHTVEFANDQGAWYVAFAGAMQAMSEVGFPANTLLSVDQTPESPTNGSGSGTPPSPPPPPPPQPPIIRPVGDDSVGTILPPIRPVGDDSENPTLATPTPSVPPSPTPPPAPSKDWSKKNNQNKNKNKNKGTFSVGLLVDSAAPTSSSASAVFPLGNDVASAAAAAAATAPSSGSSSTTDAGAVVAAAMGAAVFVLGALAAVLMRHRNATPASTGANADADTNNTSTTNAGVGAIVESAGHYEDEVVELGGQYDTVGMDENAFVLSDEGNSIRLKSVRRGNPLFVQSVYEDAPEHGPAAMAASTDM